MAFEGRDIISKTYYFHSYCMRPKYFKCSKSNSNNVMFQLKF